MKIRFWWMWLVLVAVLFGVACSQGDDDDDNGQGNPADDDAEDDDAVDDDTADDDTADDDTADDDLAPPCEHLFPFTLVPGSRNVPFPNDLFTYIDPTSPTYRRVYMTSGNVATFYDPVIAKWPTLAESMDQLNGFGCFGSLLIPASTAPMAGQLPVGGEASAQDRLVMLITDADSPHNGEFWSLTCEWNTTVSAIQCRPRKSLPENTTVTVAVLDDLAASDGGCYRADNHFQYIRAAEADTEHPYFQLLEPYRRSYIDMFDALDAAGIPRERVLSGMQYTTVDISHDMVSVHDQLVEEAADNPPTWHDVTYTPQAADSPIDVIIEGKIDIPDWRDRDSGWFNRDEEGLPYSTRENEIDFRLTIPKTDGDYPQPFPVAIHGHGIMSSMWEVRSVGEILAPYGIAVLGIDFEFNGARSTGNEIVDALSMINVFNPAKMRDVQRQTAAEIMWLVQLVRNLDDLDVVPYATTGDGDPDLDTDSIFYTGHSWGSIMAGEFIAFIPEIDTFALDAPAGDWISIAMESPNSGPIFEIIDVVESQLGFELIDPTLTAMIMGLHVIDAVDPATLAQFYREPREDDPRDTINIMHQFISYDDTLGTNACLEFAYQYGYPQLEPVVVPIPDAELVSAPRDGSGAYQYDTAEHNLIFEDPSDPMVAAHHLQMGTYLRSRYDDGTPMIIDPFAE